MNKTYGSCATDFFLNNGKKKKEVCQDSVQYNLTAITHVEVLIL